MKTLSLLAKTLQPKLSLCQMIITIAISNNTASWNQPPTIPPSLMPPYPVFTSLFFSLRGFSVEFTAILSTLAVPPVLTDRGLSLCVVMVTQTGCRARLPWRPHRYFLFLSVEGKVELDLRSPVGSDDLCPLCGLHLYFFFKSVCECVLIFHLCED